MDLSSRRLGMRVAATHLTKQAVELTASVHTMAECLDTSSLSRARFDTEAVMARVSIAAIRQELANLEALVAGHEPPIPLAPRAA